MAEVRTATKKSSAPVSKNGIPVYDVNGSVVSSLDVPKAILDATVNMKLLAQYNRVYLANQRQGTAASKTRGMVTGSTKKIYRQKGTGNARHGSRKAPIFVGGGITFGPSPRKYALQLNQKQNIQALAMALHLQYEEKKMAAFAKAVGEVKKTKEMGKLFKTVKKEGRVLLVVSPEQNKPMVAVRNIPFVSVISAHTLHAYAVMKAQEVIFLDDALSVVAKRFTS